MPITRVTNESTHLSDLKVCERECNEQITTGESSPQTNLYRQFQASILIGRVLELLNDSSQAPEQLDARVRMLDLQLRRAIEINLGVETSRSNSVIEALAMNRRSASPVNRLEHRLTFISALVIMHQWNRDRSRVSQSETTSQSQMVIETMTTIMVDTIHDFLPRFNAGWPKSHHPQGTQSVYLAALALLLKQGSPRSRADLGVLKEMLRVQSRRWAIAGKYTILWKRLPTEILQQAILKISTKFHLLSQDHWP